MRDSTLSRLTSSTSTARGSRRFLLVVNPPSMDPKLKAGDLLVFPKAVGPNGEHGHMGVLAQVAPLRMLHAADAKRGIAMDKVEVDELRREAFVFRWRGPLAARPETSLGTLFDREFAANPAACASPRTIRAGPGRRRRRSRRPSCRTSRSRQGREPLWPSRPPCRGASWGWWPPRDPG